MRGKEYFDLPKAYIIFICDFDPFDRGRYRYTFRHQCQEDLGIQMEDESETIFLSTKGNNPEEVPVELVKFLKYVRADLQESTENFEDDFIESLQKTVHEIKQSRRMEERYMLTELLMQDERRAGREEGRKEGRIEDRKESILEILSEIGIISDALHEKIMKEETMAQLKEWTKLAAKVTSIEQFIAEM